MMKVYWSYKSIPEMQGLSKVLRKDAWLYAWRKVFRHWQIYAALIFLGVMSGLGSHYFNFFGSVGMAAIGGFVYGQVVTMISRPYISDYRKIHNV